MSIAIEWAAALFSIGVCYGFDRLQAVRHSARRSWLPHGESVACAVVEPILHGDFRTGSAMPRFESKSRSPRSRALQKSDRPISTYCSFFGVDTQKLLIR